MGDETAQLEALVKSHEDLEFTNEAGQANGKVKCISTGQEIPPRLQLVKEYINGNKYKKSREWYSLNWAQYEPDLIQHTRQQKFLYCTLTGTMLPKNPLKVKAHIESKRFKDAKNKTADIQAKNDAKVEKRLTLKARLKAEHLAKLGLTGKILAKAKSKPKDGEGAGDAQNKKKRKRPVEKKGAATDKDAAEGSKEEKKAGDEKALTKKEAGRAKRNKQTKKHKKRIQERSVEGRRKSTFVKKDEAKPAAKPAKIKAAPAAPTATAPAEAKKAKKQAKKAKKQA